VGQALPPAPVFHVGTDETAGPIELRTLRPNCEHPAHAALSYPK